MPHLPRPKKIFGQNFLSDPSILSKIAATASIKNGDKVLEIGPGRGALTRMLLSKGASVSAVEIDTELSSFLRNEFESVQELEIIEADIMEIDLSELVAQRGGGEWKIVANLPYNISTPLIFRLVELRDLFPRIVVMLQKEVGERLASERGSKSYGAISVICRQFYDIRSAFTVKPGSFFPRPKVDSVVVCFDRLENPLDVGNSALFRQIVKGAFAQRRKTVINSLKSTVPIEADILLESLESCGINPLRRGETLSLEEFALLSRSILSRTE